MGRKLHLVPTAERLSQAGVILELSNGNSNVADLMRRSGLSRGVVRGLQRKHGIAPIKLPGEKGPREIWVEPPAQALPTESHSSALFSVWALRAIALILAVVGGYQNYQFARSQADGLADSHVTGALGIAIDLVSVVILSASGRLWDRARYGQFGISIVIWLICLGYSLNAGIGFNATTIGDTTQGRESVVRHRAALSEQVAALAAERARITEARAPEAIDIAIQSAQERIPLSNWVSSRKCTDDTVSRPFCAELKQLWAARPAAARRVELDGKISELKEQIAALPPIAVADAGASYGQRITRIDAETLVMFRIVVYSLFPSLGGLMLLFARSIR